MHTTPPPAGESNHSPPSATLLHECLPAHLRGPATVITKIAAGLSGAGVYQVDAVGVTYVLKASSTDEALADWERKLQIQRLAADAGLAPQVIHADKAHRAVVSSFVVDRSFPAFYRDPRTHETALALLGHTLRRIHELPLLPGAGVKDPREFLATTWSEIGSSFALPAFVGDAVRRVITEDAAARERPLVLSHNDVNPSNLVYNGTDLVLLDWDASGPNDPFYDLAAIAVFLRMDDSTCAKLIASHDGEPVSALPPRFNYNRRLVAVFCGVTMLNLARKNGHSGAEENETFESAPSLGDFYQRMRAGALSPATAEGQWCFGLALVKAGVAL